MNWGQGKGHPASISGALSSPHFDHNCTLTYSHTFHPHLPQVLQEAVVAALACTHIHPAAIDGALAQAVATAWLSRAPDSFRSDPVAAFQLLAAVKAAVRTDEMRAKVGVIEEAVRKLHAAAAAARDGAEEAAGKAPVTVAVAGADEGAAAKPQAAVVPAGAEENAAEDTQAAVASAGAEEGVVQAPAGAAAGAEAEEGAVAKLQAAVASAGAQEGVGPPPGGTAAAAVAAERGANEPKQSGSEFKLDFESPAWEVELTAAFELDTGHGFQIRATDAEACSLLALCMHWTQPEQVDGVGWEEGGGAFDFVRGRGEEEQGRATDAGGDTNTIPCMVGQGALGPAMHCEGFTNPLPLPTSSPLAPDLLLPCPASPFPSLFFFPLPPSLTDPHPLPPQAVIAAVHYGGDTDAIATAHLPLPRPPLFPLAPAPLPSHPSLTLFPSPLPMTQAVIAAVHYGGDTDTIACMAGALAGALHGSAWLPARWLDNLENDEDGRDAMKCLARDLAQLDVRQ